jgi:4-methylaminobutanoate oxidase (formaldehyde-forming)
VLFGGYEANAPSRWEDGAPWEHGGRALPADEERFAVLMAGAVRRFPFLADAGVAGLVCHPDAMTPDANPLLGEMPGVPGFWLAAGLSLNGFGGAGGIGKAVAEQITAGETEVDVSSYRAWRFGDTYRDVQFTAAAARETYRYYYRLRYPLDADEWGRPQRTSALYGRLQEQGAVLGSKNGWERADYLEPGRPWRRAGADQRAFGWTAPPYLDRLRAEHSAFRERAGIVDMTSFGKTAVEGPGALALLERACCNRIDRPVGAVIYTQMLDARGGILADVTVTRLADDRFRVVSGAGAVDADRGWLEHARRTGDLPVSIRDESERLNVIGLWGPAAREILAATTDDDVSSAAFGFRTARPVQVGPAPVLAQRITYVGELGYELYVEPGWAVQAYDLLTAAGADHGLEPCGYRSLEGLRMEKGYRYYGTDLTPGDTPDEAGLAFCVDMATEFTGREALQVKRAEPLARRIRTLLVGGSEYRTIYGGEAVHRDGAVVGRLRSASYGFTVGRNLAYAYLPTTLRPGDHVAVEVFGELVAAEVADDVQYDPGNERVRS